MTTLKQKLLSLILLALCVLSTVFTDSLPVYALSATPAPTGTSGVPTGTPGFNGSIPTNTGSELTVESYSRDTGGDASSGLAACSTEIIKGTVVAGALTALGVTDRIVGVGTAESANALGQIFTSSTTFLDYLNKNCLDPMAREVFKKMLAKSEQSVLTWANNGFKGGPLDGATFPTNLNEYFNSIKDSATDTWLAGVDETNPFAADIKNAVYAQKRSQDNGYTPDLAESIFAAQCTEYKRRAEKATINTPVTKNDTGFVETVSNGYRNYTDKLEKNRIPNNGGFRNGAPLPPQEPFSFKEAFVAQKAYAQTAEFECRITTRTGLLDIAGKTFTVGNIKTSSACRAEAEKAAPVNGSASFVFVDRTATGINRAAVNGTVNGPINANRTTGVELGAANQGATSENPCSRPMATAADKQAVIDNYNSKSAYPVAPMDKWSIVAKSLQCKNMSTCATQVALVSRNSAEQNAQQIESQTLANNDGNTGIRICVSYLPQSREEIEGKVPRKCADERAVTPGSIVAAKVRASLETPTNNLLNQATSGTFKDLVTSAITALFNKGTNQLLNDENGFLSFGGRSKSKQGAFTSGVANLDNTSTVSNRDIKSVNTSLTNTDNYIATLTENKETLDGIVVGVGQMKTLCSEILSLKEKRFASSGRGALEDILDPQNDSCNIDPAAQDYAKDPTAGARLASNPIYVESRALESTKSERDQLIISIKNATETKRDIQSTQSEFEANDSVGRDIELLRGLGSIAGRIPEKETADIANSNSESLASRLKAIEQTIAELQERLKSLK